MDMRYFIILVAFVLYKKKAKTVEDVFFVFDIDFVLITYKGGRFSDIGILLMSKKGVVQKYTTSPPPPEWSLRLFFVILDTLYCNLVKIICLSSRSSRFGHILTKMPWTNTACSTGREKPACV